MDTILVGSFEVVFKQDVKGRSSDVPTEDGNEQRGDNACISPSNRKSIRKHFSRLHGLCCWPVASCDPYLRVGLGVLCTLSLSSISGPLSLLLHSSRLS